MGGDNAITPSKTLEVSCAETVSAEVLHDISRELILVYRWNEQDDKGFEG